MCIFSRTSVEWWWKAKAARFSGLGVLEVGSEDLHLLSLLLVGIFC